MLGSMDGPDVMMVNPLTGNSTKLFRCSECGTAFSQKCHLRAHERIHSGEKPFKCAECGAAFAEKGNLGRHLRIHSSDKPYICQVCGDSFSHMGSLSRHRRRKHKIQKQFRCNLCGCTLAQVSGLELHMRIKHGARNGNNNGLFVCADCGVSFSQAVDLVTHSCIVCNKSALHHQHENEHTESPHESTSDGAQHECDDIEIVKSANFVNQALTQSFKTKVQWDGVIARTHRLASPCVSICRNSQLKTKWDFSDFGNGLDEVELRNLLAISHSSNMCNLDKLDNVLENQRNLVSDNSGREELTNGIKVANFVHVSDSDMKVEIVNEPKLDSKPNTDCRKSSVQNCLAVMQSEESMRLKKENIELKSENTWLKLEIGRLRKENQRLRCNNSEKQTEVDGS